ncbi:NUDIX hydrolase [Desulfosarcina widdelii]|uniref:NUDIX hydrolase n=2 Tax=Desulfosarcina widdelii TaxID=947919 RepID=A0A5K7YWB9_9BACT|nr:NUDIX hydrolase [Desulfosarcina widdelii]
MELYLLRRSAASRFMPGVYVFPGGRLEAEDRDTDFWLGHVDLSEKEMPAALNGRPETILPFAVAAIRETWEEAGVLLAGPMARGGGPATAPATKDFNSPSFRRRPESSAFPEGRIKSGMTEADPCTDPANRRPAGGLSFKRLAGTRDLILSTSKMAYWSRWITPQSMPKRFDTCFFIAPVKRNQRCRPDNRETVDGIWISPREALTKNSDGSLPLSPPALVTLHQMLSFADLREMVVEARNRTWPAAITPRLWPLEKGGLLVQPWDPDYERDTVRVDEYRLQKDVLPVGAPFSRLWLSGGVFRPVRNPDS